MMRVGTVLRYTVAAHARGGCAIHFGLMGEHAGVSWTHGMFFAIAGWLQVTFAAVLIFRPNRGSRHRRDRAQPRGPRRLDVTRTVGLSIGGATGRPRPGARSTASALSSKAWRSSFSSPLLNHEHQAAGRSALGVGFAGHRISSRSSHHSRPSSSAQQSHDNSGGSGVSADGHNHGGAARRRGGHFTRRGRPGSGGLSIPVPRARRHRRAHRRLAVRASGPTGLGRARSGRTRRATTTAARCYSAHDARASRAARAEQAAARAVAAAVTRRSPRPRPPATASRPCTCRASARTTRTRARGEVRPRRAVGAAVRRHDPRLQDRRPELPRVPPERSARRLRRARTTCGTSTTSTAVSASTRRAWWSATRHVPAECAAPAAARSRSTTSGCCTTGSCPGFECTWGVFAGECPELGGQIGGTAFDQPDPDPA